MKLPAAKWLGGVAWLVPAMVMAQQVPAATHAVTSAASLDCGKASSLVYRPPQDLIELAAKRLQAEGKHYQRHFEIIVTVGEDGLVREVQMQHSSGHRLLDVAVRNWAFGQMYAPLDCGAQDRYLIRLPLDVFGGD